MNRILHHALVAAAPVGVVAVIAPAATGPVAGSAVVLALGIGASWNRTTVADVERWDETLTAGGRVSLRERLVARFPGTPTEDADTAPDSTPVRDVEVRTPVDETSLRALAGLLDEAGYATDRTFVEAVHRALTAAGPVPMSPDGCRAWIDTVTGVLLAEGYMTRMADVEALLGVALTLAGRARVEAGAVA